MCHWSPIGEDGCPLSKWPIGLVQAKIRFYVHCNRTHVAHKIPHQDDHICKKWWNIKVRPCSVVCRTFGYFNPKVRGMIRYFFETREKWIYIKLIYAFFVVDYANSLMTTLLGFLFYRNYFFRQSGFNQYISVTQSFFSNCNEKYLEMREILFNLFA